MTCPTIYAELMPFFIGLGVGLVFALMGTAIMIAEAIRDTTKRPGE